MLLSNTLAHFTLGLHLVCLLHTVYTDLSTVCPIDERGMNTNLWKSLGVRRIFVLNHDVPGRSIEPRTITIDSGNFPESIVIVRVGRIELPSHPWQGRVLPLNHTRNFLQYNRARRYYNIMHESISGMRSYCAHARIRTWNNGFEDRCDIHFTTRAESNMSIIAENSHSGEVSDRLHNMNRRFAIPPEISEVTEALESAGFEAWLVGGCVRDLLRSVTPKDWDVTTNANPDQIISIFSKTFYENTYGTVGVVNESIPENESDPERLKLRIVEVTPFRKESNYSNFRHPDQIVFTGNLNDDLQRRDFTMNAIAYSVSRETLVDLYGGEDDIANHLIRTVGSSNDRFGEDALRVLRAVRFGAELGFAIESETLQGIQNNAHRLEYIAKERIRDEFSKIILSARPMDGIILANHTHVLEYIVPELAAGISCEQNGDHIYDVWEHNLRAVQHAADRNWPFHVRLSALFHDIGKPATRKWSPEKSDWTFYGHDVVGGRMTEKIASRLKYPKKTIDTVSKLVRYHLFFSDIEKITLSAVRRIVRNVGPELVWDLMDVRSCDRIGMGRPKETPYRMRKYHSMIEEAMRAPVSVGMLKIDGKGIMELLGETPGPRIGWILHALFDEILDDPDLNTQEYIHERVQSLSMLPQDQLRFLGEQGKDKKIEKEGEEVEAIRKKHRVN